MKTKILSILVLTVLILTSCGEDGTSDIVINLNGGGNTTIGNAIEIKGNYTTDLTLDATKEYILTGPTIFETGTTLTIPAGTVIKASATGADVYLAIAQ